MIAEAYVHDTYYEVNWVGMLFLGGLCFLMVLAVVIGLVVYLLMRRKNPPRPPNSETIDRQDQV